MNIVIVIDIYDMLTNGTVMTAYRFAREFRRRGHNVRIVATGAKGEGCFEVPERYIPIVTEVSAKQQIRFLLTTGRSTPGPMIPARHSTLMEVPSSRLLYQTAALSKVRSKIPLSEEGA